VTVRVRCPHCTATHTPRQVLAACTVSWPNQRWLWFVCPACRKPSHVEVRDGTLAIGGLDGGPGPCFFPTENAAVDGLRVRAHPSGVRVTLRALDRTIPAKR
jgi:hypothetical protein